MQRGLRCRVAHAFCRFSIPPCRPPASHSNPMKTVAFICALVVAAHAGQSTQQAVPVPLQQPPPVAPKQVCKECPTPILHAHSSPAGTVRWRVVASGEGAGGEGSGRAPDPFPPCPALCPGATVHWRIGGWGRAGGATSPPSLQAPPSVTSIIPQQAAPQGQGVPCGGWRKPSPLSPRPLFFPLSPLLPATPRGVLPATGCVFIFSPRATRAISPVPSLGGEAGSVFAF